MTRATQNSVGAPVEVVLSGRPISTELYWIMPSPRAFTEEASSAFSTERTVVIRLPSVVIPGLHSAIEAALDRVHLGEKSRRWLKIEEGMNVSTEIGAAMNRKAVSPEELAVIERCEVRAIVLEATCTTAVRRCEEYLAKLGRATAGGEPHAGRPHILALLQESLEAVESSHTPDSHEIRFSGALASEEMAAYVAVRMTDRPGPAQTGLFRHLVSEFAGFDAHLAEALITFPEDALLALPQSLQSLAAEADVRWRSGRWAALCYAELAGKRVRHTLHEIQLSRHEGPEKREAQEALKRKYWRACVRSLLPYLEEHRPSVMAPLRGALEAHAKSTGGKLLRPTISGKRLETNSIEDTEYNQIPGLIYHEGFTVPANPKAKQAADVCFAAKTVRDDLAHMRAPTPDAILKLTSSMQRLLAA